MIRTNSVNRIVQYAVPVLALLFLNGCFFFGEGFQMDEALPAEQVQGIKRGETTKEAILQTFGPPAAIARQGTFMVFPPPGIGKREGIPMKSELFLELFSAERQLTAREIVYFYNSARLKAGGFIIFPVILGGFCKTTVVVDRLWLLIDENTGIVEDYVFRGAE